LPSGFAEGGFIRTGYSPQLDEYKKIQNSSNAIIKQLESSYRKKTGVSTLKISETKLSGRYIDIPSSQMQKMASHKEFFHVQSLTNSVRYRTNELIDLQTKIQNAKENAIEIELEIYNNLREMITKHSSQIREVAKAVASLDVFTSIALLARECNYRRPKVLNTTEDMKLEIIGARHPIVELAQNENGIGTFVSNDCQMSAKKNRIMIITGPNMGGKSTYLRQNALVIIMAQCGFYVPADKAEFSVVDKVFSRVGAMDNLAKDQSTFMVEMVETANILTQATSQSFVIMDEVGRGTATRDGLAIAWSIVEYIHSVLRCRCLFATHYHELTDIQAKWNDQTVGLFNSQVMEGSNRSLQFLYKISPGITSKSFGVHVAQIAGVPRTVTDRAEQILRQLDQQQDKLHIQ
jgi:DNA mismatch repair protein MutS